MELWDSHCHIDDQVFEDDRDEVMVRARSAGVVAQVVPAVGAATWPRLKAVCTRYPGLYPAYGLHPMYLAEHEEGHLARLDEWLGAEALAAVGECGLDYYVPGLDHERQRHFFEEQLRLARAHGRPVVIHARKALDEVIAFIRRVGGLRGVIHSFSGSEQQARQLVGMGFMLGFGGPITYERAHRLRRLVADLPMDALLLETDAPDQPLADYRGQRNEPARLPGVLAVMAELRGMDPGAVAAATTANARLMFAAGPETHD